jgi:hypothetical protein
MELRREAYTMALYVAICLLAALAAVSEPALDEGAHTFELVWGTTVGLALAHWFAFRMSARLYGVAILVVGVVVALVKNVLVGH